MPNASGSFHRRMALLGALFLGCAVLLIYRLYTFQWLERDKYTEAASEAHQKQIPVPPRRGSIYDTNGNPLALTVQLDALTVIGKNATRPDVTAQALAPLLEMSPAEIAAKIDPTRGDSVTIKDHLAAGVSDAIAAEIERSQLKGLSLESRPARQYPEGSIAPQVLGFIGTDRDGLAGIELSEQDELRGEGGTIETETDITNQELILARRVVKPPRDGSDLVLTLDRFVQRTIERELAEAVRANRASGGLIMVMEPSTGAVLGMANVPSYTIGDPINIKPEEAAYQKAIAVTNQYEPGSVMKLVTMAGALDRDLVTPQTVVMDSGVISFPGARGRPPTTIRNWDFSSHGAITTTQVLIFSNNVGIYQVAEKLGRDNLYQYLEQFGFGQKTGIQLPGEVPGTLRTPNDDGWTVVDMATNAFGQGIAVTPLQMLNAVSTIGNDGLMMRPTIVKEIDRPDGVEQVEPRPVRQVISPQAAQTLRSMMVQVMEQPANQANQIPGIRVADKTGTADFPTDLGYTSGKTFASVVALIPADKPRLAILIRLDAPAAIYGGAVASPILKRVGTELAAYYRIPASDGGR